MSTYCYWQCVDHEPPLRAESESGQHDSDRPEMCRDYAQRQYLIDAYEKADLEPIGFLRRNTLRFFRAHPKCELRIINEYGHIYPPLEGASE